MKGNIIKFAFDFNNKLNATIFTTIRISTEENKNKFTSGYFKFAQIHDRIKSMCIVLDVKEVKISDIPDLVLMLDLGAANRAEALDRLKMVYPNANLETDSFLLVTLENVNIF